MSNTATPTTPSADPTPHSGVWQDRAACAGAGTGSFFPSTYEEAEPALALCAECPVAVECHVYAKMMVCPSGVWAGVLYRDGRVIPKPPPRMGQCSYCLNFFKPRRPTGRIATCCPSCIHIRERDRGRRRQARQDRLTGVES